MYLGVSEALHRGAKVVVVARLISAVVADTISVIKSVHKQRGQEVKYTATHE